MKIRYSKRFTGPWLSYFEGELFNPSYHGNADTRK